MYRCLKQIIRTPSTGVQPESAEAVALKKREAWLAEIGKVVGPVTWSTYNPGSGQHMYAELFLMRNMNENDLWHRVDDAWHAAFLPQGGLVRRRSSDEAFFVVRAYEVACVVWPAEQAPPSLWKHKSSASSLTWIAVFDLEDLEEIPVEWASPLHMFLEERSRTFR